MSNEGILRAAMYLKNRIRRNLSTPYPPASDPGEYPHRRTGELRRSVQLQQGKTGTVRVGANVPHGRFLELGTSIMEPRPWLSQTLQEERTRLAAIARRAAQRKT
jgi:HK97 gp10 family phage protein